VEGVGRFVGGDAVLCDVDGAADAFVGKADRAAERLRIEFVAGSGHLGAFGWRQAALRADKKARVGLHADEIGAPRGLEPRAVEQIDHRFGLMV